MSRGQSFVHYMGVFHFSKCQKRTFRISVFSLHNSRFRLNCQNNDILRSMGISNFMMHLVILEFKGICDKVGYFFMHKQKFSFQLINILSLLYLFIYLIGTYVQGPVISCLAYQYVAAQIDRTPLKLYHNTELISLFDDFDVQRGVRTSNIRDKSASVKARQHCDKVKNHH